MARCKPHYYILGEPQRGIVRGVCKFCGRRRRWPAVLDIDQGATDNSRIFADRADRLPD